LATANQLRIGGDTNAPLISSAASRSLVIRLVKSRLLGRFASFDRATAKTSPRNLTEATGISSPSWVNRRFETSSCVGDIPNEFASLPAVSLSPLRELHRPVSLGATAGSLLDEVHARSEHHGHLPFDAFDKTASQP
jgi:hypothetical protein